MSSKNKTDSTILGVSLGDLLLVLQPTSIMASIEGNALIARHEHYTCRVEVVAPENPELDLDPIRAVVRITTELPKSIAERFKGQEEETMAICNRFAALGALTSDRGNVFIGSRLTIYEVEDAWSTLHLPLLMLATVLGAEAILGGMRYALTKERSRGGPSHWTEKDMDQTKHTLSRLCACTTGGLGLTAEFGLIKGAVSAIVGDHKTALFQLMADQPHPELGGGLFCLLQMPHLLRDKKNLQQVCAKLNSMEMAAHDLPPHFGAWCPGNAIDNPVYLSFFPNEMHSISGIATNAAFWAMSRAQWANGMLASLGVRL